MNQQSSIMSSDSENTCLNESLLFPPAGLRLNRNLEEGQGRNQQIVLKKELLLKHPGLLLQTMKILQQRCTDQGLRKAASEYRQVYENLQKQGRLTQDQSNSEQHSEQHSKIIDQHKRVRDQIAALQQQKQKQTDQLVDMNGEKLANRLKLKLLIKIIKEAMQQKDQKKNPYVKVDQQYKEKVQSVLRQYLNEKGKSRLSLQSQDPNNDDRNQAEIQQARRIRLKQQIAKLQSQQKLLKAITLSQQQSTQNLKQKIIKFQKDQSLIYKSIQYQGDINFKQQIIGDLVVKLIRQKMDEKEFDHGLDKTVDQYVGDIQRLRNQTFVLREQLQRQSAVNTEKKSLCELLEKKFAELKKQSKESSNRFNQQAETHNQIQTKSMKNQQIILKAYHFEGNKIQSQISQIEAKHKTHEVSMFLDEQSKTHLECNQKVSVKKQAQGFFERLFFIKSYKDLLTVIVVIMFIAAICYLTKGILTNYEYIPQSQPAKAPRTVIHRYQGKNRIVDGQIVNISHFDKPLPDEIVNVKESIEQMRISPSQQEVIVVEVVPQRPKMTWVETLKMEYK